MPSCLRFFCSSQNGDSSDPSLPPPTPAAAGQASRHWRDVFWLCVFLLHLLVFGFALALLGINRFNRADRLNIDRFTNLTGGANFSQASFVQYLKQTDTAELTETYWPFYGVAGGASVLLAWAWLSLLRIRASQMMKVSIHILTTYLAVVSVLCFWAEHFFWGVVFAVGAALQFLYVMSVLDRYFWFAFVCARTYLFPPVLGNWS